MIKILSRLPGASSNFFFVKGRTVLSKVVNKQKEKQNDVWYKDVHTAYQFNRVKPSAIDDRAHWKFEDNATGITTHSQQTYCGQIADALVYGTNGAIVTNDNLLVEDASPELGRLASEHSLLYFVKMGKPLHLRGKSFLLAGTDGAENYFHWLTDVLPKLAIAEGAKEKFEGVNNIIVNSTGKEFQQAALKALGLNKFKILSLTEHPYILCDKLIIASPTCLSGNTSAWIVEFLRNSFKQWMIKDEKLAGKKIYISRERSTKRRLLNEEDLWQKLSTFDIEKVFLEELSFEDQVKLFFNASTIIGVHGAGFTNLCFCDEGASVVELFPPSYVNQCYWNISSCLGLKYHYIIGEGTDNTTPENHLIDSDFKLSANQIDLLQHRLLKTKLTQP